MSPLVAVAAVAPPQVLASSEWEFLPLVVCAFLFVGGLWLGLVWWRRRWAIIDTPTSKAAAAFLGRCEVTGVVQPVGPVVSPLTGAACALWRFEVQERIVTRNGHSWETRHQATSIVPFWITDDSGSVLVQPGGADVTWSQSSIEENPEVVLAALHQVAGAPVPAEGPDGPIASWPGTWRVSEHWIGQGEQVFAIGGTRMREDGAVGVEFATTAQGADNGELVLIAGDEEKALGQAGCSAWGGLTAAVLGAAGLPWSVGLIATLEADARWQGSTLGLWSASLAGGLLLVLWVMWLARVYNRLVTVRHQAEQAWALIEVATQRRTATIEPLVAVVRGYAAHELDTLELIGRARSTLTGGSRMPTSAQLAEASRAQGAAAVADRRLLELGEAYPQLKADQVFLRLSGELRRQENLVAYARGYYNDAVEVLRTRRGTFPYVFFAPLVRTPTFEYFELTEATTG
ncbi:MAG: LemA family protein [Acidimicrobiales bacterium]|nr:LemA family protein [Acidimicrobiales bacterium]